MASSICVYCSSSEAIPSKYTKLAETLGTEIGKRGFRLIYGGTRCGTMGIVADAAKNSGATVIGIIPQRIQDLGLAYDRCDELIVTKDLRDRKALMDEMSESFVALPGGIGTLEEVIEIFNLKYLRYHQKPVIFLNHEGFYEPLFQFFNHLYEERFTKKAVEQLYAAIPDVPSIFRYLEQYQPIEVAEKWYDRTHDEI